MSIAATVRWLPVGSIDSEKVTEYLRGKSESFGTLKDAVTFFMERLGDIDRATAVIALDDGREIGLDDVEKIYTAQGDYP